MACCLCFLWGSKSWITLLLPVFAVFASFSSGHGVLFISISISVLFVLSSTLYSFTFSKHNPILVEKEFSARREHQEKTLVSSPEKSHNEVVSLQAEMATIAQTKEEQEEGNAQNFLMKSKDLYSECESMDRFSSTSTEEYHSSDVECWPYSMEQKLDFSDDSISDEESLIEIAIPTGQFVSPEQDPKFNLKCCKLSKDHFPLQKYSAQLDFLSDMNEEDNLIEIDIYMGSIKSSSYRIQTPL